MDAATVALGVDAPPGLQAGSAAATQLLLDVGRHHPRSHRPPVTPLPESTVSPHYQLFTVYQVPPGRAVRVLQGVGWGV